MQNILALVLFSILLVSCTESKKELSLKENTVLSRLDGGKFRGGTFKLNEVNEVRGLYPHKVGKEADWRVASQIYEGLVKFNPKTLEVISSLAEKWDVSKDGKTYTFYIREGVSFHEDQCFGNAGSREVTSKDFYYSFTKLCEYSDLRFNFDLVADLIVGAEEYFESTKGNPNSKNVVRGLKVINDYTFSIELIKPSSEFLKILGTSIGWVFPREALDFYSKEFPEKPVGTGPFKLAYWNKEEKKILLERNNNYWRKDKYGNSLPYLDEIEISFVSNKRKELFTFKRGGYDMIYQLPVGLINEVVGKFEEALQGGNRPFKLQTNTSIGLRYYKFNLDNELFQNVHFRKAFNYAIDREELITHVLKGEGAPAIYGIIPPSFNEYTSEDIEGFVFNPKLAKKHLAKAKVKMKDFSLAVEVRLNSNDETTIKIATTIKEMIKEHLNIDLIIKESGSQNDTTDFFITDRLWLADFPDPGNFFRILDKKFLADNYLDTDEKAISSFVWDSTNEDDKRIDKLKQIDQNAINEARLIPLFYHESIRLISLSVENFPINSWEYRDFSEVYFNNRYKR